MVSLTRSPGQSTLPPALCDAGAFGRELLLKCCLRWTRGDLTEAEDLLGDAYLQVMEAAQRRPVTLLKPRSYWLTVINNLGRDRLRRTRRWRRDGDEEAALESLEAQDHNAEDLIAGRECLAQAARGLRRLSQRQRSALLLRFSGVGYAQIATQLMTSEMNARKLVETARGLLTAPRPTGKARAARLPAQVLSPTERL
jgi:RNA polymerase sigma factor (sigma-70 family)